MPTIRKTAIVIGAVVGIPILAFADLLTIFYFSSVSHVMTKYSPNGLHSAKLIRGDSIDVNFWVNVDGTRVYHSPDFAPGRTDYREQVIWSASGEAVVFQVAGESLFGYHVGERRPLTDVELSNVVFPNLDDLGFEGTLPN